MESDFTPCREVCFMLHVGARVRLAPASTAIVSSKEATHTVVGLEHAYGAYGWDSHAYGCMLATVGMEVLASTLVDFLVDSYLS